MNRDERIAVVGLGYVGLPVALAFAREYGTVVGFDINEKRVQELRTGHDRTREVEEGDLKSTSLLITSDPADLDGCTFFVVTVPTPIDDYKQPDLRMMKSASELVGKHIQTGGVVVYESTVYPGVTEDVCGPIIAKTSGLERGTGFKLGYSPERINPGDKTHTLATIVKIVSGEDEQTLERVANAYGKIVKAGVHRAPSIKVAEAAKVIENTQRDINIALMNELAHIFDLIGIPTCDVLAAAGTKWNFLKFSPGLVGGHCIGVDPYYLTAKAEELGYHPHVILAGRRINDGMGRHVAEKLVKLMSKSGVALNNARVAVLGLTFKENVPDLRNSRVPDIIAELREYGIEPLVHDPLADHGEAHKEYGLSLVELSEIKNVDGLVLAVPHSAYADMPLTEICALLRPDGVIVDVRSMLAPSSLPQSISYYSL